MKQQFMQQLLEKSILFLVNNDKMQWLIRSTGIFSSFSSEKLKICTNKDVLEQFLQNKS